MKEAAEQGLMLGICTTSDEKAANAKLTEAAKKLTDATAALKPRRDQAFQDLVWALFNTREFLFNH